MQVIVVLPGFVFDPCVIDRQGLIGVEAFVAELAFKGVWHFSCQNCRPGRCIAQAIDLSGCGHKAFGIAVDWELVCASEVDVSVADGSDGPQRLDRIPRGDPFRFMVDGTRQPLGVLGDDAVRNEGESAERGDQLLDSVTAL